MRWVTSPRSTTTLGSRAQCTAKVIFLDECMISIEHSDMVMINIWLPKKQWPKYCITSRVYIFPRARESPVVRSIIFTSQHLSDLLFLEDVVTYCGTSRRCLNITKPRTENNALTSRRRTLRSTPTLSSLQPEPRSDANISNDVFFGHMIWVRKVDSQMPQSPREISVVDKEWQCQSVPLCL